MAWPIESDYFEAVQNPHLCFGDADLRQGRPTLTPLGLPRPITGAFASVYQFTCPSGTWAVRCFLREFADQQRRYDAISRRLRAARLPCAVGFEYQPQGIRVGGRWCPILKMEWVDGQPLNAFVADHLDQPDVLRQLARQWVDTMADLAAAGIAHGDLQHGNVLVSGGKIRLIDYDGMYVPDLAGLGTHEQGHRNYQHPDRGDQFDAAIDHFSAWVIFVSLSAVAIDPGLWRTVNGGDECLLFRREDFERPGRSKLFETLDRSGRPELKALAAHCRALLRLPVDQVPGLAGGAVPTDATVAAPVAPTAVPDWLRAHVVEAPPEPAAALLDPEPPAAPTGTASAGWIIDHLVEVPSLPLPFLGLRVNRERVMAATLVAAITSIAVAAAVAAPGAVLPLAARAAVVAVGFAVAVVLALVLLWWRFRSLDVVGQKATASAREGVVRGLIRQTDSAIAAVHGERERVMEPLVLLDLAYREAPAKLQAEAQALLARLEQTLAELTLRRQALDEQQAAAVRAAEQPYGVELATVDVHLGEVAQAEANELAQLATAVRDRHLAECLQRATLDAATLDGIGPKLMDRLRSHGITCAADVGYRVHGIPGIGPAKVNALKQWRFAVEVQAGQTAPQPTPADAVAVRAKHEHRRRQLLAQAAAVRGRQAQARQDVVDRFVLGHWQLAQEQAEANRRHEQDAAAARHSYDVRRRSVAEKFHADKDKVYARRREHDGRLVELHQSLFGHQLEAVKAQRARERFAAVTFPRYTLRVVGLRRDAA